MNKENITGVKPCVVYVTTFPPRGCGIATFSSDLISYTDELFLGKIDTKVVAMKREGDEKYKYSEKVIFEVFENEKEDYVKVALALNAMPEVKIVSIQHEFGIFGKNFGESLLVFLENLKKPVVVTFHTVLPNPEDHMRAVVKKILEKADRVVVMTELSKKILMVTYGVLAENVEVIPHGIHPQLFEDTLVAKKKLSFEGKLILTTFGFLSRGKGIEYAIRALPEIIKKYPNILYLVLGETHPVVKKNEGEVYRDELKKLAKDLKVDKYIVFNDDYLSKEELLMFLQATDIYLSLSQNPDQAVSGTLTYALGAGRAVISTAFTQAKEIVTPKVGKLIGFNDFTSLSEEIVKFFDHPETLSHMGKAAYFYTRKMTWSNVSLAYMRMFSRVSGDLSEKDKYIFPFNINHIKELTDDFGIFQFADLHKPDPKWGYTLDDNARALVLLCWSLDSQNTSKTLELAEIFLSFIERASRDDGFFNYFTKERTAHIESNKNENLEDSNSRALWALAVATNSNLPEDLKLRAQNLFDQKFILHKTISSPRAAAFYIKAFSERSLDVKEKDRYIQKIKVYADFLVSLFEKHSDEKWQWFEDILTYSNAILPEALLVAYDLTKDKRYFEIAKSSLDFLIKHSFKGDLCVPVGHAGWFKKGGEKQHYDQQPEEVSALVLALHRMNKTTGEEIYRTKMMLVFDWFLGNNLSHQIVYTHYTGGSYDGIQDGGVNLNQGAESTISYLLARLIIEK